MDKQVSWVGHRALVKLVAVAFFFFLFTPGNVRLQSVF
jgi:hypothetical protein